MMTAEDLQGEPPLVAPWDSSVANRLNTWQATTWVHSFTCAGLLHQYAEESSPDLLATVEGWVCPDPDCDYTQDWAHRFMIEVPNPFLRGVS